MYDNQLDSLYDEEAANRIKWERKQKIKRSLMSEEELLDDEALVESPYKAGKRGKKQGRSKRRQLVYDEMRGQFIVKRKRKRQPEEFDDWQDE